MACFERAASVLLTTISGVIASAVAVTGLFALNSNDSSLFANADTGSHSIFLDGGNLIDVSYPNFKLAAEGALKNGGDFVSLTCGWDGDYAEIGGEWGEIVILPEGGSVSLKFDLSHVSSIQEVYLEGSFDELSYTTQENFDGKGGYRVDVASDGSSMLVLCSVTLKYTC